MKAAMMDDLAPCREELGSYLHRYFNERYAGEPLTVEEFASGEDFLSRFAPEAFDLIFIDQYMDGISGIDTARKIRALDPLVALVFVTTSQTHAIESYGVRACGYLVKPYAYEDFERTMQLAGLGKIRDARSIMMEQEKLLLREILWCDRSDHYIQIHTEQRGDLRFRSAFAELAALLTPYPQFLTCYKSCIVNAERVECIDGFDFLMDTGARVPFAAREKKTLEALFNAYLFRREREEVLFA